MKDKDSIQIEEAYKKVLKESDSGYPEHILKAAQELGRRIIVTGKQIGRAHV